MIVTTEKGIARVRRRLMEMQERFPRRAVRALVEARKAAREAFIAGVTEETTMTPARAKRLVTSIRPPKEGNLATAINVKGDRVGAQHFALTESGSGILVQFRRDEPPVPYPYAFEWRGNWFQRRRWTPNLPARTKRGNIITRAPSGLVGRHPVFRIEGPRVTSLLANVDAIRDRTATAGLLELDRKITKALRV